MVIADIAKSVRIRSYSSPHFPAFGLNTERYEVSLRIQSEWWKMPARTTPNTDTFRTVRLAKKTHGTLEKFDYNDSDTANKFLASHSRRFPESYIQPAFAWSKLTIKTLEQGVIYGQS